MMEAFVFIVLLILCFAVVLSAFRSGKYRVNFRLIRYFIVLLSIVFYGYWFAVKSVPDLLENAISFQIINKLPQPIDFYILKNKNKTDNDNSFVLQHSGKIRAEHYRVENLEMQDSDEYWVVGFLGKKNMVYFSQHAVSDATKNQIIEVRNYINHSMKLSEIAEKEIEKKRNNDISKSVWISLSLLLIFLNIILLLRRK